MAQTQSQDFLANLRVPPSIITQEQNDVESINLIRSCTKQVN